MHAITQITAFLTTSAALLAPSLAGPVPLMMHDSSLKSRTVGPEIYNIGYVGLDAPRTKMHKRDDFISNMRRSLPDERLVRSADLGDFLAFHGGKRNDTVLVEDTGEIIDMSTVKRVAPPPTDAGGVNKRYDIPPPDVCHSFSSYTASNTSEGWTSWFPASPCVESHLDSAGGSTSIGYSFSLGYSETVTFGYTVLETVNYGFSFGITETYSASETWSCNIPGGSIGQLWFHGKAGYATVSGKDCTVCSGLHPSNSCNPGLSGQVGFPHDQDLEIGCSAGDANVKCDAGRNWTVTDVSP